MTPHLENMKRLAEEAILKDPFGDYSGDLATALLKLIEVVEVQREALSSTLKATCFRGHTYNPYTKNLESNFCSHCVAREALARAEGIMNEEKK